MIKSFKSNKFRPNAVTQAVLAVLAAAAATQTAQAGPGYGDAYDLNNNPFIIQSYFAQSPTGFKLWTQVAADGTTVLDAVTGQPVLDSALGAPDGYDPANRLAFKAALIAKYGPAGLPQGANGPSGKALRKFVDPLPLLSEANAAGVRSNVKKMADGVTDKYIPVAKPSKWRSPQGVVSGDDYYEIASVEYKDRFHSDLGNTTTLRGYVQVDHEASNGRAALPGSKAVALKYPDGSQIYMAGTDANGKPTGAQVAVLAYDNSHFLGPVIQATQNVPTRIKYLNLLPVGRAELGAPNADGSANVIARNGDLFLPVDPSITGAGFGPDGVTTYTQNRGNIHLHGGDSPWISDGGPHTWITPQGEADPANPKSLASPTAAIDPTVLASYLRGPGALNVPDMYDPGAGAMTYYFPNGQSARMEWYHDHTVGITRLNAYAGLVSAYFLTDATEQSMIAAGKLPGADATIPLILGDRTFVPDDIALQDARWNTSAWGNPGDSWFPHVYETVQDPQQATNFNAVGRWHWGPWFWPSFPSLYNLPSGAYGDVTTTPEAWHDTPTVNGVAYPTMEVEPKPYRLRVLNAAGDRSMSFNLFVADDTVTSDDGRTNTEMKMVPVASWANTCADGGITRWDPITNCVPQTWSTDVYGHNGGVPDPTTQGPTLYQIGNEGGRLPGVAKKDPQPTNFLLDKGRAAVLNMDWSNSGIVLGNAERADIVVDFSQYAGKTLLVYSDTGAPIPAADPRNEYFTGYGDNSATGGAEDTRPGYGPNSRTIMQIKVAAAVTSAGTMATLDPVALDTDLKVAYRATQETPVVAQSAYNGALGTAWNDTLSYAPIYVGSVKSPAFQFVPGTPNVLFNSFLLQKDAAGNYLAGSGYTRLPIASVVGGGGAGAAVTPAMKISKINVINGGSGYRLAPIVTITSTGAGSGANATATLKLKAVAVVNGGSGFGAARGNVTSVTLTSGGSYTSQVSGVTIGNTTTNRYPGSNATSPLSATVVGGGGSGATVQLTVTGNNANRRITGITVTNGGSGYTSAPTIQINGATGTIVPTTFTVAFGMVAPTVTFPTPAGGAAATGTVNFDAVNGTVTGITLTNSGAGYSSAPVPTFTGGTVVTAAAATTTVAAMPSVTFSAPQTAGGVQATGTLTVGANGSVTAVTVINPGSGYTSAPNATVSVAAYPGAVAPVLTATGSVDAITLTQPDPGNVLSTGGGGYTNLSTAASEPNNPSPGLVITITAPTNAGGVTATAGATGSIFDVTVLNAGQGYTSAPTIAFTPSPFEPVYAATPNTNLNYTPVNVAKVAPTFLADTAVVNGQQTGSVLVKTKAIQELFDPTYGRLNATFGVEIPYTSALTQTTIPLGYVDAPTEEIADGETQIWKITHNGVDTHPIHFHLVNVQLINRVGWDNFVTPPEPNELGWKETIKMSPLEDVIVAVRAKKPKLPGFGLPTSYRLLDPSQPVGATAGFTQIDPATGLPSPRGNDYYDFGWEYVWHCHILGHEENDFMRPIAFRANEAVPIPAFLSLAALAGSSVDVQWTDQSTTEYKFRVERSVNNGVDWSALGETLANATQYTDSSAGAALGAMYRVVAVGASGESVSNTLTTELTPAAPSGLTAAARNSLSATVNLSWTDNSTNETWFTVQRSSDGGATFTTLGIVTPTAAQKLATGGTMTFSDTTAGPAAYDYQVTASNGGGTSAPTATTVAAIPAPAAATISSAAVVSSTSVLVTYVDNSTTETSFELQRATVTGGVAGPFATISTVTRAAGNALIAGTGGVNTFTNSGLTPNTTYAYQVLVKNAVYPAGIASNVVQATPAIITPTGLAATARAVTAANLNVVLNWVDRSTDETGFTVERSTDGVTWVTACTATRTAAQTTATAGAVTCTDTAGLVVAAQYRVKATNAAGASAWSATVTVPAFPVPTGVNTLAAAARTTSASVVLTWTDVSNNETSFRVEQSVDGGVSFTPLGTVARTAAQRTNANAAVTYTDTTASATATTSYRVFAVGLAGDSLVSNVVAVGSMVPAAPTGLAAAARSTSASVVLSWTDASTTETSFLVERSADAGVTFAALATQPAARTAAQTAATGAAVTYTDATATADGAFVYRVTAVSTLGGNATPVTVNVAAIAVPTAPTIALVRNAGNNQVQITDTSATETSFIVQRAPVTGATVPAAGTTGAATDGTVGAWVNVATVTRSAAQTAATGGAVNSNDTTAAALVAGTTWAYRVVAVGLATGNGTTDTSTVFYVKR